MRQNRKLAATPGADIPLPTYSGSSRHVPLLPYQTLDLRPSAATIEQPGKDKIALTAEDGTRLKALHEIVIGKLAKRNVDLRNVDHGDPAVSSIGHARQELTIKQGIEGVKAKEIIAAVKAQAALNKAVQCSLLGTEIRVTGKKRDDLQAAIAFLRGKDFGVSLAFKNFRD